MEVKERELETETETEASEWEREEDNQDRPLLCVVVLDDDAEANTERVGEDEADCGDGQKKEKKKSSRSRRRYTVEALQAVFQFVGIRPKVAKKLSKLVFASPTLQRKRRVEQAGAGGDITTSGGGSSSSKSEVVEITRKDFSLLARDALLSLGYSRPQQVLDFATACRIRERRTSVTILLCGTSGCGKSTLASLLASRLGLHSVMSTDSVRHMMRSFDVKRENKFIWSSTYDTYACAVEASGKGSYNNNPSSGSLGFSSLTSSSSTSTSTSTCSSSSSLNLTHRKAVIRGYKAQSEMVLDHLSHLIEHAEKRRESLIIEGVHLSMNFMIQLMKRHQSILPFVIFISNEQKHKERFAVRARAMSLRPVKNKYVNNFRNIRIIQDYLCKKADKHLVPKIDNSNIDRSVATIHTILLGCLRSSANGNMMLDPERDTCEVLHKEFKRLNQGHMWGGKGMLQLIRQKKTDSVDRDEPPTKNDLDQVFYSRSPKKSTANSKTTTAAASSSKAVGIAMERYHPNYLLSSDDGFHTKDESLDEGEVGESSKSKKFTSDGNFHPVSDTGSIFESHEDSDFLGGIGGEQVMQRPKVFGNESLSVSG